MHLPCSAWTLTIAEAVDVHQQPIKGRKVHVQQWIDNRGLNVYERHRIHEHAEAAEEWGTL